MARAVLKVAEVGALRVRSSPMTRITVESEIRGHSRGSGTGWTHERPTQVGEIRHTERLGDGTDIGRLV